MYFLKKNIEANLVLNNFKFKFKLILPVTIILLIFLINYNKFDNLRLKFYVLL